jgi:hypothetical protein
MHTFRKRYANTIYLADLSRASLFINLNIENFDLGEWLSIESIA